MKNFAVPESFTLFLESEERAGSLNLKEIDFKTLYQYTLKYSSSVLYNVDFEDTFQEEIKNYLALLYGSGFIAGNYFRENGERIIQAILRFVHDIVYKYSEELFVPGRKPIVINGSKSYFTVEYSQLD